MTPEDRSKLKQKVLEEIDNQKQLIASLTKTSKPVSPDNAIGRLTRMEAINDKSVSEANLSFAKQKLFGLENTLGKIEQPDFGLCVECQNPIPPGRIMLMPENPYCVPCVEKRGNSTNL